MPTSDRKDTARLNVSDDTKWKVNELKAKLRKKSYDDIIQYLVDYYNKKAEK